MAIEAVSSCLRPFTTDNKTHTKCFRKNVIVCLCEKEHAASQAIGSISRQCGNLLKSQPVWQCLFCVKIVCPTFDKDSISMEECPHALTVGKASV